MRYFTVFCGLVLVLAGMAQAEEYTIDQQQYSSADVNRDGNVDAVDIQVVINAILGVKIDGTFPDINNDGEVNALDLQNTINVALGVDRPPILKVTADQPEPFPFVSGMEINFTLTVVDPGTWNEKGTSTAWIMPDGNLIWGDKRFTWIPDQPYLVGQEGTVAILNSTDKKNKTGEVTWISFATAFTYHQQ